MLASAQVEPNDTISDASDTGLSSASPGTFLVSRIIGDNPNIMPNQDVDMYSFQLDVGDRVTIDIDADEFGSTLDSMLRLFDSLGFERALSDDDPGPGEVMSLDSFIDFHSEATDTYYVGVSGWRNDFYDPFLEGSGSSVTTGAYDIEITVITENDSPADTIPEALDTGLSSAFPGSFFASRSIGDNPSILPNQDVDMYSFQLDLCNRVTIDIDVEESPAKLDSMLRVFDSLGFERAFSDDDPGPGELLGSDSFIDFTALGTGIYYVGVSGWKNDSYDPFREGSGSSLTTGAYDIEITVITQPPTVCDVSVQGTTWAAAGIGPFSIPVGSSAQLTTLPWSNIDQIRIMFSEDVVIDPGDLSLRGVNVDSYAFSFAYDAGTFTATATLAAPIEADKLRVVLNADGADPIRDSGGNALNGEWTDAVSTYPSGDITGTAGGNFLFRFNVLPGDVNGDTFVNVVDVVQAFGLVGNLSTVNPRADMNADGFINDVDVVAAFGLVPDQLPPGEPSPSLSSGDGSAPSATSGGSEVFVVLGSSPSQTAAAPDTVTNNPEQSAPAFDRSQPLEPMLVDLTLADSKYGPLDDAEEDDEEDPLKELDELLDWLLCSAKRSASLRIAEEL